MNNLQNYESKNKEVAKRAEEAVKTEPELLQSSINFSWSNWGFGQESLFDSAKRLSEAGIDYIELHGNRYGDSLGYSVTEVRKVLDDFGLEVSGICGMFTPKNELASNEGWVRQEAIDYLKRNIELGHELGAEYFLIVPAAVGRSKPIDEYEVERSIETLAIVADELDAAGIKGAIEPIRSAETSIVNTFDEAADYIERLGHPAVQWINGDVYHMAQEESHIGKTILEYGDRLINLHLADTNRRALGKGMLDLDTLIKALYAIGYSQEGKYATAEPLGPGGNPYPAMHGNPNASRLDALVNETFDYFRERETEVKKELG